MTMSNAVPSSTLKDFLAEVESLTPEKRDGILRDGAALLWEFGFSSESLTASIPDSPEGLNATLQNYFYLYLWILKRIDEDFITSVSAVNAADPAAYEKVKTTFMSIIKEIPEAMVEPVLAIYNPRWAHIRSMKKQAGPALDNSIAQDNQQKPNKTLVLSSQKAEEPVISVDQFSKGLAQVIANVQQMIKTDFSAKIEASFAAEKAEFLKIYAEKVGCSPDNEELITLVDKIAVLFRDWADTKEQKLDEEGRVRMNFLISPATAAQRALVPDGTEDSEEITLERPRLLTFAYKKTQLELLPIMLYADYQAMIHLERQDPVKNGRLTPEEWAETGRSHKILYAYLTGVIQRLEHANRWVFAAQQISTADNRNSNGMSATTN